MQMGMKETLGLEFQLELIDYNRDNFTHADMSPEEFAESMVENDESLMKYGLEGDRSEHGDASRWWSIYRFSLACCWPHFHLTKRCVCDGCLPNRSSRWKPGW